MTKQQLDVAHQAMRNYLGDNGITHVTTETVDALIQLLRNLELEGGKEDAKDQVD